MHLLSMIVVLGEHVNTNTTNIFLHGGPGGGGLLSAPGPLYKY